METKPGYLTTEFWTTIFLLVLGMVQNITGAVDVNDKWVTLAMAIVAGIYNASRGIAKQGVPYTPPVVVTKDHKLDAQAGTTVVDK